MVLWLVDGPTDIRERWRARSLAAGWAFPSDWWSPAVEAVIDAIHDGGRLEPACDELGRDRARAGVALAELLDDLDALFGTLPAGGPSRSLVRAAALGWADVTCALLASSACEDPLSQLTTPAYLRTRMAELYREASRSGAPVRKTHALVVVRADQRSGFDRLAGDLRVADSMRAVFSGGETLCAAGPAHTVALVGRDSTLMGRVTALRRLFDDMSELTGRPAPRVWVEGLPAGQDAAFGLLDDFAR